MWRLLNWLVRRFAPTPMSLSVGDVGVAIHGGGGASRRVEWVELTEVAVVTTDRGPFIEDVFLVLSARSGEALTIPHPLVDLGFIERLQRLPGFDNETFIEAMGCAENGRFVCWRKVY